MQKVTGIGGMFFRSENPDALAEWYEKHLGVRRTPQSYEEESWRQEAGVTVFAPFPKSTEYFGNSGKMWMVNFRVRDLEWLSFVVEPERPRSGPGRGRPGSYGIHKSLLTTGSLCELKP
ncbi:MAG TPA: hypothetical protein VGG19_20025 [Tepidisphaeraceae bacterium]|jgi:hypothetical protein